MGFDLTVMSIISFIVTSSLLVVYSIMDIRNRKVRNEFVILGTSIGCVALILTEHFVYNTILHLTALLMILPISYLLFRIGSIGGGDVKILITVALLSPGIELGTWNQPIFEAIIGLGGELVVMLLGGYLYWRVKNKEKTPPLIPILLIGYFIVQLFALF